MRRTPPLLQVTAALALLVAAAQAYPRYWSDPLGSAGYGTPPSSCDEHPSEQEGRHAAPQPDTSVAFTVAPVGAESDPTSRVCPGKAYSVQVSWEGRRMFMITAPNGASFRSAQEAPNTESYSPTASVNCANRLVAMSGASTVTEQVTVPCNATGAFELKVTTASRPPSTFLTGRAALEVDASCADAACTDLPSVGTPKPDPTPSAGAPKPDDKDKDGDDDDDDEEKGSASGGGSSSAAPAATSAKCTPSVLGYACSQAIGDVRVHYTLGGAAAPDNVCTRGLAVEARGQGLEASQLLHMAVEAQTDGYVSLAFAAAANRMAPADAILGWVPASGSSEAAHVDTYHIASTTLSASETNAWALSKGVARVGSALVVCFTRALAEPSAKVSATLDPAQDLKLNWAVAPSPALVVHTGAGGGTLNIQTGAVAETSSNRNVQIRWHGALMSVGWALLLPLGAMFPAHRFVLRDSKVGRLHVWFHLHSIFQCLGFAVMTAGFAVAYYYLSDPGSYAGDIGETHKVLGTVVYAMACVQLLAGFFRPGLDSPHRPWFTHGHRWWGRLTLVASWVSIYLGIKVYHMSIYQEDMTPWLVAVSAALGCVVLVDLALYLVAACRLGKAPAVHEQGADESRAQSEQGLATIEVAHISAKGVALQVEEHPEGGGQAPVRG